MYVTANLPLSIPVTRTDLLINTVTPKPEIEKKNEDETNVINEKNKNKLLVCRVH